VSNKYWHVSLQIKHESCRDYLLDLVTSCDPLEVLDKNTPNRYLGRVSTTFCREISEETYYKYRKNNPPSTSSLKLPKEDYAKK